MINKTISALIGSSVLATGLAVVSSSIAPTAQAASLACDGIVAPSGGLLTDKVTGTSGCEVGSTNNDFINPLQVNEDNMFGGGWSFFGKDPEGFDFTPNSSGEDQTGEWNITNVLNDLGKTLANTDVMLVFKGGQNSDPTDGDYVGYLLDQLSGTWDSPFENANNGNLKNVSHISLYYRDGGNGGGNNGDGTKVPEPSTMLALGLIGSGMFLSRRRQNG